MPTCNCEVKEHKGQVGSKRIHPERMISIWNAIQRKYRYVVFKLMIDVVNLGVASDEPPIECKFDIREPQLGSNTEDVDSDP